MKKKTNYEKRKEIFNFYANNLKLFIKSKNLKLMQHENNVFRDVNEAVYICPLCLKSFNEKAIEGENPLLTLEHNPPRSLEGKAKILTCKECNNSFGSKTDVAILDRVIKEPFLKGIVNSSIDSQLSIANHQIKGKLKNIGEKKLHIYVEDKSNPFSINDINEYMQGSEGEINFTFTVYQTTIFKRAILKIAYLEMFSLFGYCFAFDENSSKLRDAIINPESMIPINFIDNQIIPDYVGLNFIIQPENISNFLICIKLKKNNIQKYVGVIIPTSGEKGWENYLYWSKLKRNSNTEFNHYENYQGIIGEPNNVNDYYSFARYVH